MKYLNSIVLAIFLTACTDYVQQMDEDFEEWELAQELANSSSSSQKVKSSSSLKSSSSETSSSSAKSSSSAGSSSSAEAPVSSNADKVSSSSVVKPAESSSSSVVYIEPCNVNGVDKCEYGTLVDSRDGKKYKTVTIGTQIWMAQNLSYDDSYSWCYGGSAANCDKYGRMYTWAMAMDSVGRFSDNSKGCGYPTTLCNAEPPVRGICPEGWHIPTKDEFKILIKAVGGGETPSVLQSKEYWRGAKDSYGFSVIPIMGFTSSRSAIIEDLAVIWGSSIDASDGRSDALGINETGIFVYPDDSGPDHGNAIRCVSDKSVMPKLSSSSSAKSSSSSAVVPQSSSSSVTVSSSSEKEVSSSSSEIIKSSSSSVNILPQSSVSDSNLVYDMVPVLGVDSLQLSGGGLVENDGDVIIPIRLSVLPSTDVTFDYCFAVQDTTKTTVPAHVASLQDFQMTTASKFPVCGIDTQHVLIPQGSQEPTEATKIRINVITDTLTEGDENLTLKIFNLAGAVMPGNKMKGEFELEIADVSSEGYLTDSRDGQVYKTVVIGEQTWMAENLNFDTDNSFCYNDENENCAKYGRLYSWSAAKEACPSGWHLPLIEEMDSLITAVGGELVAGKMLRSTQGWNSVSQGDDTYGFSVFPAGRRLGAGSAEEYGGLYDIAYFWSASEENTSNAYGIQLYYDNTFAKLNGYKNWGWSVRCVKD